MEPFRQLVAVAAPMPATNIDTDQILPARFLPRLRSLGLGPCLFRDQRFAPDGTERPDFVLNRPAYRAARIIVAGWNFGCGSSREAAVYALADYGIRAVIAPAFGDIFFGNCFKNGVLPIVLDPPASAGILAQTAATPGTRIAVDLEQQVVTDAAGQRHGFAIDAMRRHLLLNGLDEIDHTLSLAAEIRAFEQRRAPGEARP